MSGGEQQRVGDRRRPGQPPGGDPGRRADRRARHGDRARGLRPLPAPQPRARRDDRRGHPRRAGQRAGRPDRRHPRRAGQQRGPSPADASRRPATTRSTPSNTQCSTGPAASSCRAPRSRRSASSGASDWSCSDDHIARVAGPAAVLATRRRPADDPPPSGRRRRPAGRPRAAAVSACDRRPGRRARVRRTAIDAEHGRWSRRTGSSRDFPMGSTVVHALRGVDLRIERARDGRRARPIGFGQDDPALVDRRPRPTDGRRRRARWRVGRRDGSGRA